MKIKLLIVIASALYGIWYMAVGGKKIEEKHVHTLYSEYTAAFAAADGKKVCDLFSDDVSGQFKSSSRSLPMGTTISKSSACSSVDEFYRAKKLIEEKTGQEMYTNFEYTINKIEIAPDQESATVNLLMEMRVGTESAAFLDMRSEQTDVIKRSFGKARFVKSDGIVRFFR